MKVTQLLINLFYRGHEIRVLDFSESTSYIHSKFSHFYCHFTEVVNTFSLCFSLLPGLSPNINSMTPNNHCIRFRIVFYRLLIASLCVTVRHMTYSGQRQNKNLSATSLCACCRLTLVADIMCRTLVVMCRS